MNVSEEIFSGVARVLCGLGQEVFLRSSSTKSTEFEVKIYRCGISKSRTFSVVVLFFFDGKNT